MASPREIQAHLTPTEIATHLRAMSIGDKMIFGNHTVMSLINTENGCGARIVRRVYLVIDHGNDEEKSWLSFEEAFQLLCVLSAKRTIGEETWERWTE